MPRVDELIQRLCPDGVEYKQLGELAVNNDSKRKPITRKNRTAGPFPYYGASGIQDYVDGFIFDGTYLLIGEDGTVITPNNRPVLNYVTGKIWVNNHAHVLSQKCNCPLLKYIYYALATIDISSEVRGTPPKLNQKSLNSILIPVPPIEVQQEIVRILDAYTELEQKMEANLQREIAARKKQYANYRDELLRFGENTVHKSLSEVFYTRNGYTPSKKNPEYWQPGGTVPWFRMEDIRENGRLLEVPLQYVNESAVKRNGLIPKGSIIVATSATIGEHALLMVDGLCNQRFTCLTIKEEYSDLVSEKFVFYWGDILDEFCKMNLNQGNFASVNMDAFNRCPFPIPPLNTQKEIVRILDAYTELEQKMEANLQREIAARKRQYEHYRDALLDLPRKES